MKFWSLVAIALVAVMFCADEARAGGFGFGQQRVFVQAAPNCGFGQQAFFQQSFRRQNAFVPSFRQQRVFVQQSHGFQRQNVFVQQQPLFQLRLNIDD